MNETKAPPIYQKLFLADGTELSDSSATVESLGIKPRCQLEMEVFEEGEGDVDEIGEGVSHASHRVEQGFKGTGLYGFEGPALSASQSRGAAENGDAVLDEGMGEVGAVEEAVRRSLEDAKAAERPVDLNGGFERRGSDASRRSSVAVDENRQNGGDRLRKQSTPDHIVINSDDDDDEEIVGRKRKRSHLAGILGPPKRVSRLPDSTDSEGEAPVLATVRESPRRKKYVEPLKRAGSRNRIPNEDIVMEVKEESWSCRHCTLFNEPLFLLCAACERPRI